MIYGINQNIIKEELYKATIDIINWLGPYMDFENKDDAKNYISKLEEEFKNYGIKQALNSLKSKIKELVFILENITFQNTNENKISNNIIDKKSFMNLNSATVSLTIITPVTEYVKKFLGGYSKPTNFIFKIIKFKIFSKIEYFIKIFR